jgi:hypothetical protein
MVKGLPKSIIKKYGISKKAWAVYRGKNTSNPRPSKTARKVRRSMARRYSRRRGRRRGSMTIPMATVAGIGAMLGSANPSGTSIIDSVMSGDINRLLYDARERFACVDMYGRFRPDWVLPHWGPLIFGALISKFVGGSPLNINKKLAAHRIPFLRI